MTTPLTPVVGFDGGPTDPYAGWEAAYNEDARRFPAARGTKPDLTWYDQHAA